MGYIGRNSVVGLRRRRCRSGLWRLLLLGRLLLLLWGRLLDAACWSGSG